MIIKLNVCLKSENGSQTDEIILIAAGEKIIPWWKSIQILVGRLDENVYD